MTILCIVISLLWTAHRISKAEKKADPAQDYFGDRMKRQNRQPGSGRDLNHQ